MSPFFYTVFCCMTINVKLHTILYSPRLFICNELINAEGADEALSLLLYQFCVCKRHTRIFPSHFSVYNEPIRKHRRKKQCAHLFRLSSPSCRCPIHFCLSRPTPPLPLPKSQHHHHLLTFPVLSSSFSVHHTIQRSRTRQPS